MNFARFLTALVVACCALHSAAAAQDGRLRTNIFSIGPTIGTLGAGGEASFLVYDSVVLRAAASYIALNIGDGGGTNSTKGQYEAKATFAGGMIDWHPFRSGWRLSTGLRYADVALDANKTLAPTESMTIGKNTYTASDIGRAHTSLKNHNTAAPYIGFGYDTTHYNRDGMGFSLGLDIGALYIGDANVKLTTAKSVPGLAADIAIETDKTKSDLNKYYNFYPVIMLAAKIGF